MSPRSGQRLFVCLIPPRAHAEELVAWAREQRDGTQGVRVVPAENVHLTLAFLGEQPLESTPTVLEAIAAAAVGGAVGELAVGDPLLLPPRRPRVLAVSVDDPAGQLAELQRALSAELAAAVGHHEARAFRPHLTLARMKRDARPPRSLTPPPSRPFTAHEVVLMRSYLEPAGARYEALERLPLL